jgi:hypothetical protein
MSQAGSSANSSVANSTAPSVSVVIPTKNRPAIVRSIVDQVAADDSVVEVIVVMGRGDPAEPAITSMGERDARIRALVLDPAPTAAAARLAGAKAAHGELLLLLDDDVLPAKGVPSGHARRHDGHDGLVVLGAMPVRLRPQRRPGEAAQRLYAEEWERSWEEHRDNPLSALWGGHMSVRRADFLRVEGAGSGWDGSYYEDRDLGLRLRADGLAGVEADELRAEHLQQRGVPEVIRDADRQGRGLVRLAQQHPDSEGQLPAHATSPQVLSALSRCLDHKATSALLCAALTGTVQLAGALHWWRGETGGVRLIRRLAIMSAVRRELRNLQEAGSPRGTRPASRHMSSELSEAVSDGASGDAD